MAILSTLLGHLHHPPHLRLDESFLVDAVRSRSADHCLLIFSGIHRWYENLLIHSEVLESFRI